MKAFFEVIQIVVVSVFQSAVAIITGAFAVKNSVDTVKDQILAAILGIPLIIISAVGIITAIVGVIRFIIRLKDKLL